MIRQRHLLKLYQMLPDRGGFYVTGFLTKEKLVIASKNGFPDIFLSFSECEQLLCTTEQKESVKT